MSLIPDGGTAAEALANSVDFARAAECLGYNRYWLAEHHKMQGFASAATAVVIGHVAGATKTMRVGTGGIMLPNHAPLVVAEQFGAIEALCPGRIDLGLGRAPGSDMATVRSLRRYAVQEETCLQDVVELLLYFDDATDGPLVRATPRAGMHVPVGIPGSSLYGAHLAAHLGLRHA